MQLSVQQWERRTTTTMAAPTLASLAVRWRARPGPDEKGMVEPVGVVACYLLAGGIEMREFQYHAQSCM